MRRVSFGTTLRGDRVEFLSVPSRLPSCWGGYLLVPEVHVGQQPEELTVIDVAV
jgi:hypothetical protein